MTPFLTSRVFNATPTEVFAAISEAQRLARWWGPTGFINEFELFEFKTGGQWRFTMIGPDGANYPNEAVFHHITPDQQVVINHTCPPLFQLTISLVATPVGCLLSWQQCLDDDAFAEAFRHIIEPANEQNLDRLAVELRQF